MGPRALFTGEVEEPCEALRPNLGASDTPSIGSSARGTPNGGTQAPLGTASAAKYPRQCPGLKRGYRLDLARLAADESEPWVHSGQ